MISRLISKAHRHGLEGLKKEDGVLFFLDLLHQGKPRVFYQFNGEQLTYVAYYEEAYGSVTIEINGQFHLTETPLSSALLLFILEKEGQEDEATVRARYGEDGEMLALYSKLGPEQARLFREANERVERLARKLEVLQRREERKPTLYFVLEGYGSSVNVSLKIGFTKLYLNRKIGAFLSNYFDGRPVTIQKESVILPPHSFPENIEEALHYLYTRYAGNSYYSSSYPLRLSAEEVTVFLFLLIGETVVFDGVALRVHEPVSVTLRVGANGELISSLPLDTPRLVRAGSKAFVRNADAIDLYEFVSESAGELFGFYHEIDGLDARYIADSLARKILPVIPETEVEIDETFAKAHPVLRPKIEYYIGLEDNKRISYHTVLYIGLEERKPDEFARFNEDAQKRYAEFTAELKRLGLPEQGRDDGDDAVVFFLKSDLSHLRTLAHVYVDEELSNRRLSPLPQFGLRTTSGEDWFEVQFYASGYTEDELVQIYNAYVRKKKYVRLRDSYVVLDENDEQLRLLSESFSPSQIGVELPLYQALKLQSVGAENDANVVDLIKKVQNYKKIDVSKIPSSIVEAMRPYQRTGIQFLDNLYSLKLSGILSDDMGLGKTLQSFGLFSLIEEEKPMLVVCPKSLVFNWMEERDKWYPDLEAHVLVGAKKDREVLYALMHEPVKRVFFVSYDTLRNDVSLLEDVQFSLVLLDEGQYIANVMAMKTKAVKGLKADSRFVLTGTPVQNSLMDLWSIFDFLLPGYFPPLTKFKELYGSLEFSSDEARQRLMAKIKPFLLGRKKKDVLQELPDKENISMALAMSDEQRKVYDSYLARTRELLMDEENSTKLQVLSMLTRLRQICITPSLFLEGEFGSSKIDYLIDSLMDLKRSGRKAIVFSSFVSALTLIQKRCKEVGLSYESITGDTSAKVRVILAERFNKPDSTIDVMLVSLKAGGTGLNLIGADTVFHLDPWWNLAAERQAEDRAHRIGQTNKVTVFKLVIKNSIEEKVLSLQQRKGLLSDMADEAAYESSLNAEDLKFLLS